MQFQWYHQPPSSPHSRDRVSLVISLQKLELVYKMYNKYAHNLLVSIKYPYGKKYSITLKFPSNVDTFDMGHKQ